MSDVIHKGHLRKYNAVFQFLMQVKWAIWALETQRFPILFKRRRPYSPMNMYDLVFKRLAMARNWVMYSVQSIHSHLMTLVIQSMGQQLPKKIELAASLRDLVDIHGMYIDTIHEYCFQTGKDKKLRLAIEQLLSLVGVLHNEWQNMESLDAVEKELVTYDLAAAVQHVDCIENAYIKCHNTIADLLSQEVFVRDRDDCEYQAFGVFLFPSCEERIISIFVSFQWPHCQRRSPAVVHVEHVARRRVVIKVINFY